MTTRELDGANNGAFSDILISRRAMLRGSLAGGLALGVGAVAGCTSSSPAASGTGSGSGSAPVSASASAPAKIKRGGTIRVGTTGGGSQDTLDAHAGTTGDPDIARYFQLYEPLTLRDENFVLQNVLAESVEAGSSADVWTIRLRPGLEFHNGKTVTADDVIYTIQRILNPKTAAISAPSLSSIDLKSVRRLDSRTVRVPLKAANVAFPDLIGGFTCGIVPVGYDPKHPIGTGPFKYVSFTPGSQSVFTRFDHYWRTGQPYLDQVVITDFADDQTRVNALLSGQVDCISNLPASQLQAVTSSSRLHSLIAPTGNFQPFVMRVDTPPFNDARVRQAMRLIVDRPQLVSLALGGQGKVANDLFCPYDEDYNTQLPQRQQDIDQARSLLRSAGQQNLKLQMVTAPIATGSIQDAQIFAQQAKAAGVTVTLRQLTSTAFFGSGFLKYTFTQDFWTTLPYLQQVADSSIPGAPYNETHFNDPKFNALIAQAQSELDPAKRKQLLWDAQAIEWDSGGYIIPAFSNQVDAYSDNFVGFKAAKTGIPLGNYGLREISQRP
jgi:peptide/nickel transport system substrate-binding protein